MAEGSDEQIAREIADAIIRDVAELPDRTSPEYEGDTMLVTADELRLIVMHPLIEALSSVRSEERERAARIADAHTGYKPTQGSQAPLIATIMNDHGARIASAIRSQETPPKGEADV